MVISSSSSLLWEKKIQLRQDKRFEYECINKTYTLNVSHSGGFTLIKKRFFFLDKNGKKVILPVFYTVDIKKYKVVYDAQMNGPHPYHSLSVICSCLSLNSAFSRLSWQRFRRSSKRSIYNIEFTVNKCIFWYVSINSDTVKHVMVMKEYRSNKLNIIVKYMWS